MAGYSGDHIASSEQFASFSCKSATELALWSRRSIGRDGAYLDFQIGKSLPRLLEPIEQGDKSIHAGWRIFRHVRFLILSLDVVFGAKDVGQHRVQMGITRNFDLEITRGSTRGFHIKWQ